MMSGGAVNGKKRMRLKRHQKRNKTMIKKKKKGNGIKKRTNDQDIKKHQRLTITIKTMGHGPFGLLKYEAL